MRRFAAFAVIVAMSLTGVSLVAADPARAPRAVRQAQTGGITGTAQSSQGQTLANYTVRIRNLANGNLAGSTTSGTAGEFSFAGLNPGSYAIEIVDSTGKVVGTSASIAVTAGGTVSITVTASAAAALLGGAAAGGGISTALIVTTVAVAAGIVGIVVAVNKSNASPSR